MKSVSVKARAKINLTLDVTGVRNDGYHLVEMIMQTVSLYDTVNIRKEAKKGIWLKCSVPWLPCDERNIAYKAAKKMIEEFNINEGVSISITKRIPVAAGLAGGSADCAAVIKGMNEIFKLNLSEKRLMEIGASLGSDVPFCIMEGTALAQGIGEKITPVSPCPKLDMVLVKLPVSVSTPAVYKALDREDITYHPDTGAMIEAIEKKDVLSICENLSNVLEIVTVKMHPAIENVKAELLKNGACGVLMSGSGPSVYGIFENKQKACEAADKIRDTLKIKNVNVVKTEEKTRRLS